MSGVGSVLPKSHNADEEITIELAFTYLARVETMAWPHRSGRHKMKNKASNKPNVEASHACLVES